MTRPGLITILTAFLCAYFTIPAQSQITGPITCNGAAEGKLIYNADHKVVQFCNGTKWLALGGSTATDWTNITNIPAGFDDDTDDGITVESDPTVDSSVKDGVDWSELSGIPAGFADDTDDGDNLGNHTATTTLNMGGQAISSSAGTIRDGGGSWIRTYGDSGWYNNTYGGGWYMSDTSWIRAAGDKSVITAGEIRSGSTMRSPSFTDLNDANYYVDPNGYTMLNDARANIFYDRANTAYYVQPRGTSIMEDVRVGILYDRYNTGYYVQPRGTSILNALRATILYDQNNTSYRVDPNGTSRLNVLHTALNCRQVNGGGSYSVSYATCASNEFLMSGGAMCAGGTNDHLHINAPEYNNNRWAADCYRHDGGGDAVAYARAVCCRKW